MIIRMLGLEGLVTLMQLAAADEDRINSLDADVANENTEAQAGDGD